MEFCILGPLEVRDGEASVPLGPAKERTLLAVLLLQASAVVSRERLINELWGEAPPPTAAKALNVHVSQLRKRLAHDSDGSIVTRPPGYALIVDAEQVDSARFERLVAEAHDFSAAGDLAAARRHLGNALSLWRGPALDGIELESSARSEVGRLETLRLAAQMDRIDCDLNLGLQEQVIGELTGLVSEHPLKERLHGQLILALYRAGRQADALKAYREARETLVSDLGIEPSTALQRLERGILNHDPALEVPAGITRTERPPISNPARSASTRRRWASTALAGSFGVLLLCAAAAYLLLTEPTRQMRLDANTIGLIEGGHTKPISRLPGSSFPVGLAVGDDSLWLTTSTGQLVRTDLRHSGSTSSLVSDGRPGALAIAGNSVWMLEPDRGVVEQIDSSTVRPARTVRVGNGPTAIAAGWGALWITNELDGTLSRVDANSGVVRTIPIAQDPDGVTVGAGSVWVSDAGGAVLRVQPTDTRIVASIAAGSAPGALAFGGGSVWVANRGDGTVSRIDPASNTVRATIPIGRSADGVAVAGGAAWAISTVDGSFTRIDLALNRVARTSKLGSAPALIGSSGRRLAVATVASIASHRGGTLRLIGGGDGVTLDPATWWTTTGWRVLAVTNDGLLTVRRSPGPSGLEIVPDLARAAPLIAQGRTSYTFQLRPGLRYSNGRPVSPRDVRASIERLWKIRSYATTIPELRLGVIGEATCARAPTRCNLSRGIVVDDATGTVGFRLARPNPQFMRLLTLPVYDILPAGTPAHAGGPLPATGPYRIARFVPGRLIELDRNDQFHLWSTAAQPPGYPDRISWRLGVADRGAISSVRAGRSDYAVLQQPGSVPAGAEQGRVQIENEPFPALIYAFLNTRVPPFDSAAARRALNLAVDRRIVARLAGGPRAARPTCQILPPSFPGYRPWCPYTFAPNPSGSWISPDLAAAHALLRKSRTLGSRIVVWTKRDPNEPTRLAIGRYITGLLRALGYRATLRALPPDRYYTYVANSRHRAQIGISSWVPDTSGASAFFGPLLTCRAYEPASSANQNLTGYCDPQTDDEIRRAESLEPIAQAAASALWSKVDRRIGDAAPWVPLYTVRFTDVLSARVGNYEYNPMFGFLIDDAWVK